MEGVWLAAWGVKIYTVKPLIKDTPKEDKLPNKEQVKVLLYRLYRKSPLKEDNLSTKDKTDGPEKRGSTVR